MENKISSNSMQANQKDSIITDNLYIILSDCIEGMKKLPDEKVHLVITDPPYFIDGMDNEWSHADLADKAAKGNVIKGLPVGMKFDPQQGVDFQKFMAEISKEIFRVLKPGGFFICFSQARLYHRLGIAVEDAGFEIRDMLGWKYEGQAKAFSQDHFVRKSNKLTEKEKEAIISKLGGRKTPQLKPQIEPMVLAQKPKCGTFIDNWMKYETGLIDTNASLDGHFPGNIMEVSKPSKKEKGDYNSHLTVKPVVLIKHLIELFSIEGQIILDPFMGSGTTAVAASHKNRKCIGYEKDISHFKIIKQRLENNEQNRKDIQNQK